jgi:hypothetical protein
MVLLMLPLTVAVMLLSLGYQKLLRSAGFIKFVSALLYYGFGFVFTLL